jgi:DNA polymerase-4
MQMILAAARRLVRSAAPVIAERGLTLIGFAVSEIDCSGAEQLMLPFTMTSASQPACCGRQLAAVDAAVDQVRRRYGKSALTRGVLLGRDTGLEMPPLPD